MSYTVLARKWRPRNFSQLVGQSHVQKALMNAIEQERLHHAYLFTGTRGVGKTTIARIFAKCLNCETGVTSEPCGQCPTCLEIDQGRFIDLLEIDAASRTKVEDTREILDNVQYRPTRGRYKVYLIDEVHMLSNSSFNALLKTLEEPPPHVVFILATTDPQKLPVTVLSRCLQFHLKHMTTQEIASHLDFILKEEQVESDNESLSIIAKAADGSMRDALSLLDQAIAHGGGRLQQSDILDMLGLINQSYVLDLLEALALHDAKKLVNVTQHMAQFSPDYESVLNDILSVLHQIAVCQVTGDSLDDNVALRHLITKISAEDVQLFYQLGLMARKDLALSADAQEGFLMALLRMLAFRPAKPGETQGISGSPKPMTQQNPTIRQTPTIQQNPTATSTEKKKNLVSEALSEAKHFSKTPASPEKAISPKASVTLEKTTSLEKTIPLEKTTLLEKRTSSETTTYSDATTVSETASSSKASVAEVMASSNISASDKMDTASMSEVVNDLTQLVPWTDWIQQLGVNGQAYQVLNNSRLKTYSDTDFTLSLIPAVEHFCSESILGKINTAVNKQLSQSVNIRFEVADDTLQTPKKLMQQRHEKRLDDAYQSLLKNPQLCDILETFSASLSKEDIQLNIEL